MNRIPSRMPMLAMLAAAGFLAACGAAGAEDPKLDPRVAKVLADWKKRQERIKTVRYRVEGVLVRPKGSLTGIIHATSETPAEDTETPIKRTLLLDFTTNRFRFERDEQDLDLISGGISTTDTDSAFDGKELQNVFLKRQQLPRRPDNPLPDGGISTGNLKGGAFEPRFYPLFFGHGVVPVAEVDQLYPGHLRIEPDAGLLYFYGEAIHAGRRCLVFRTHPLSVEMVGFWEYWVDPDRDSALVRFVSYSGESPDQDTAIDYQATPGGWLAKNWVFTVFTGPEKKRRTVFYERMEVKEATVDPTVTDANFRIDFKPGMLVVKAVRPEPSAADPYATGSAQTQFYRIDPAGRWNEVTFVGGVEASTWGARLLWWAAPIALAAIAVGGVLYWRMRRRKMGGAAAG